MLRTTLRSRVNEWLESCPGGYHFTSFVPFLEGIYFLLLLLTLSLYSQFGNHNPENAIIIQHIENFSIFLILKILYFAKNMYCYTYICFTSPPPSHSVRERRRRQSSWAERKRKKTFLLLYFSLAFRW